MHGAPAPLLDPHPPTLGSRGRRRLEGPSQLGRVPAMPSDTRVRTETGVQAWLCPAVTRTRSLPAEGELVRCMPQAHLPESPFLALQMLSGLTQTKPSRSRCLLSPARVLASVPRPRTVSTLCDPGGGSWLARGWPHLARHTGTRSRGPSRQQEAELDRCQSPEASPPGAWAQGVPTQGLTGLCLVLQAALRRSLSLLETQAMWSPREPLVLWLLVLAAGSAEHVYRPG